MHANPVSPGPSQPEPGRFSLRRRLRRHGKTLARRFTLGVAYGLGTAFVPIVILWAK
jgi:hypothetical protein